MSAADAAKGWLTLLDRGSTLTPARGRRYDPASQPLTPEDFVAALPPPAAWPELAKAVAARPAGKGNQEVKEIGLRLLAATLTGDTAAKIA